MQNYSTSMWTKFEIRGWIILKFLQAFHIVHIVLILGVLAQWSGQRLHTYWFYLDPRLLGQNTQYTELCVQFSSLNFKRLCHQISNFVHIKDWYLAFLSKVSINYKTYTKMPFILFFRKQNHNFGITLIVLYWLLLNSHKYTSGYICDNMISEECFQR